VSRSLIPTFPERHSPTLWPPRRDDRTPIELAVEVCERENRRLKTLVVSLSEIILNNVISRR
jgi:hypothetical protein